MSGSGQNSPYTGVVSNVRTWGHTGSNMIEIGHRGQKVRSWGHSGSAAEVALTVSLSHKRTQMAPQRRTHFGTLRRRRVGAVHSITRGHLRHFRNYRIVAHRGAGGPSPVRMLGRRKDLHRGAKRARLAIDEERVL